MSLRRLAVHNIRNYELASFEFSPNTTLILGPNGSGKTSLLEAVYVMYRGSSFRGSGREMLGHTTTAASIRLESEHDGTRALDITQLGNTITKRFEVSGKKSSRLLAKDRLPVVLFEPDELRMLSSSPERRRRFIDSVLARLDPHYATTLARYQRTLLQRNELLKQAPSLPRASRSTTLPQEGKSVAQPSTFPARVRESHGTERPLGIAVAEEANKKGDTASTWESHLFAWDVKLAELATQLVTARHDFIKLSNKHLSGIYSSMAGAEHSVIASYECPYPIATYQQHLLRVLSATASTDALRGHTTCGPHRDDLLLLLDSHPAGEVASRGEMRTIMLAYKLLEVKLQSEQSSYTPLILLDDVFSELDTTREQQLMRSLKSYQTIITATDLRRTLQTDTTRIQLS